MTKDEAMNAEALWRAAAEEHNKSVDSKYIVDELATPKEMPADSDFVFIRYTFDQTAMLELFDPEELPPLREEAHHPDLQGYPVIGTDYESTGSPKEAARDYKRIARVLMDEPGERFRLFIQSSEQQAGQIDNCVRWTHCPYVGGMARFMFEFAAHHSRVHEGPT